MKISKKILLTVAVSFVIALIISLFFLKKDVKEGIEKGGAAHHQEPAPLEKPIAE